MAKTKKSTEMNQVYVGLKSYRLLVTKDLGTSRRMDGKGTRHTYECLCECGRSTVVDQANLRPSAKNPVQSCGCLRTEKLVSPKDVSFCTLYTAYKSRAKSKGRVFPLTQEKFREITQNDCHYCGIEPRQVFAYKYRGLADESTQPIADPYVYNGIDRIDSSLGYQESNCIACCSFCNLAKLDYTKEEFEAWVLKAAKHIQERK